MSTSTPFDVDPSSLFDFFNRTTQEWENHGFVTCPTGSAVLVVGWIDTTSGMREMKNRRYCALGKDSDDQYDPAGRKASKVVQLGMSTREALHLNPSFLDEPRDSSWIGGVLVRNQLVAAVSGFLPDDNELMATTCGLWLFINSGRQGSLSSAVICAQCSETMFEAKGIYACSGCGHTAARLA